MYKKLLPLVGQYIYLRQGHFSRYYEGKLLEVTPDTVTIQSFDDEGVEESVWVIAVSTITEFMCEDRSLKELTMRVSLAKTRQFERLEASIARHTAGLPPGPFDPNSDEEMARRKECMVRFTVGGSKYPMPKRNSRKKPPEEPPKSEAL